MKGREITDCNLLFWLLALVLRITCRTFASIRAGAHASQPCMTEPMRCLKNKSMLDATSTSIDIDE